MKKEIGFSILAILLAIIIITLGCSKPKELENSDPNNSGQPFGKIKLWTKYSSSFISKEIINDIAFNPSKNELVVLSWKSFIVLGIYTSK